MRSKSKVWPVVVLLDADRDGCPESVTAPTESERESAGWGRWAPPIALEE